MERPLPDIKVLVLHNRYQQGGGEDEVFAQEVALLRRMGHSVVQYQESNDRLHQISPVAGLFQAVWSKHTTARLRKVLLEEKPDIAHFHNTFAVISPSAYYACREANVPVVQTLHNYRLSCPNASCSFNGQPCEKCVSKTLAWPGVIQKCYRESRAATAGVAAITTIHKLLGTYLHMVDAYISTTNFARRIHIKSGLPKNKVFVKPNFVDQPAAPVRHPGGYALYVGRITAEKGVPTLLAAWEKLGQSMPLKLVGTGEGPIAESVRRATSSNPNIEWLGSRTRTEVMELMLGAVFLIQPSPLYEGCGMAVVEALSAGLPCIVSGGGSLGELVRDGHSGLHFLRGDADDLAAKVELLRQNSDRATQMGVAARTHFEDHYTPAQNYEKLMEIYRAAAEHRKQ